MKAPFSPTAFRLAAALAAAGAAYFALTASKCQQSTEFVPFVAEQADKCLDKIDNDADGKIDCDDPDCNTICAVQVNIDAIPSVISADTLTITGTQHNATSVSVISVSPQGGGTQGTGSAPVLTGETWRSTLSNLGERVLYTVTVVGSNGNRRDTATATFTRGN
jgi:hypothetical protein